MVSWNIHLPTGLRVAAALLAALCGLPLAAKADTLVLKEQAFVRGPEVHLGDIADIQGDQAETLASISLGSAPQPGESKRLLAALVESRLRRAGIAPGEVEVSGALQVEATTLSQDLTRHDLAASLREHILATMTWDPADTEIEIPLPLEDLVIPEGDLAVEWRPSPGYRMVGTGSFQGVIAVDGREEQTILVKARVEPFTELVLAATDIPRGRVISPADLETERMAVSQVPPGAITDMTELVGLVAQRNIFPGQPITSRNVTSPTLIRRNQPVAFVTGGTGVQVSGRAIAVSDARAGDMVMLRAVNSKETFQGVVQANGVVLVP